MSWLGGASALRLTVTQEPALQTFLPKRSRRPSNTIEMAMVTTSMKRLRFPGAIAFVLFGIVVAAGQRAPDQPDSAQAVQRPREPMHITRAPEPVVPVPSDTDLGDTTFALD